MLLLYNTDKGTCVTYEKGQIPDIGLHQLED